MRENVDVVSFESGNDHIGVLPAPLLTRSETFCQEAVVELQTEPLRKLFGFDEPMKTYRNHVERLKSVLREVDASVVSDEIGLDAYQNFQIRILGVMLVRLAP